MARKRILWLCSWYPNKTEPYNGDFVKRHAEAVSIYCDVQVIHVARDKNSIDSGINSQENNQQAGLTEQIIYYNVLPTGGKLLQQIRSHKKMIRLYKQAISKYIDENGKPDLVHVHTGMKAGPAALWMKKKFGIPYIITEHWSGFLDNADEKLKDTPLSFQKGWKKVINGATAISAVSATLAKGLANCIKIKSPIVIPNVVNTNIFSYDETKLNNNTTPTFIHISGMQPLKNPDLIIEAFQKLITEFPEAKLYMIGAKPEKLIQKASQLGNGKQVEFFEEMPQKDLYDFIRQSTALILFSSYETFGCVIIEANACGVPVIVSDIPVFHETVKQDVNGIFVEPGNTEALAIAMKQIINTNTQWNKTAVAANAIAQYSYSVVGKQFLNWYEEIIQHSRREE